MDEWRVRCGLDAQVGDEYWEDAALIVGPSGAKAVVTGMFVAEGLVRAMNARLAAAEAASVSLYGGPRGGSMKDAAP